MRIMRKKLILLYRLYSIETTTIVVIILIIGKIKVSAIIINDIKNKLIIVFAEGIRGFLKNECEINIEE